MVATPIAKLYKRCARKRHAECPGRFEGWSVCSCDCHDPNMPYPGRDVASLNNIEAAIVSDYEMAKFATEPTVTMPAQRAEKPVSPRKASGPRNAKGGLKCSPRIGAMDYGKGFVNGGYIKISAEDRAYNLERGKRMATTLRQDIAAAQAARVPLGKRMKLTEKLTVTEEAAAG